MSRKKVKGGSVGEEANNPGQAELERGTVENYDGRGSPGQPPGQCPGRRRHVRNPGRHLPQERLNEALAADAFARSVSAVCVNE